MDMSKRENELSFQVIGAALEVRRSLGPGLLESAYRDCLCRELMLQGISYERERQIQAIYKGCVVSAYRADIVVEELIILELKAVSKLEPICQAQLLSYLKLSGLHLGILINFDVPVLKTGITRVVNDL